MNNFSEFTVAMMLGGERDYVAWTYFLLCAYSPSITILVAWLLMRRGRKQARIAAALAAVGACAILSDLFTSRSRWELFRENNPKIETAPFLPAYQIAGWFAALVPFLAIILFYRFDAPREVYTRPPTPLTKEYRIRLLRFCCVAGGLLHAIAAFTSLSMSGNGSMVIWLLDAPLISITERTELAIAGCSVLYPALVYWVGVRIIRGRDTD